MTGYVDPLIGMTISFATAPLAEREREEAPRGGVGSQVLPVAQLHHDFDGAPEDGLEYLFLVRSVIPSVVHPNTRLIEIAHFRREAFAKPDISRVENPYIIVPQEPTPPPNAPLDRPSEAWRAAFLQNFIQLRSVSSHLPESRMSTDCMVENCHPTGEVELPFSDPSDSTECEGRNWMENLYSRETYTGSRRRRTSTIDSCTA